MDLIKKNGDQKKKRERATVEAFLVSHGHPNSSLIDWERESPDALVQLGDDTVGIEVTQVVEATPRRPTAPQRWEKEASRVICAAQGSFERRHRVALVVSVGFRPDWQPPKRQERGSLADELAKAVERRMPTDASAAVRFPPVQVSDPHPAVQWLFIGPTRQDLGGRWTPLSAGNKRPASPCDVIAAVQKKEPEISVYKLAAPYIWLLIDCDLSGQGVFLDVPTPCFTLATGFDRVFCCGFGMWKWVEIPVLGKVSGGAADPGF